MFAVRVDKSLFERALTTPLAFDDSVGGVSESSAPLNDVAEPGGNGCISRDSLTRLTLESCELRYLGCLFPIALCWATVEELGTGMSLAEGIVYGSTSGREREVPLST
jgi:hypothetical protein